MDAACILTFIGLVTVGLAADDESTLVPEERDCSHIRFTPFSVHNYICGSDGVTYINLPHLAYMNCIDNKGVTVVKEGYCDEEKGRLAQEAHHKFMAEYAKEIRKAIREGRPIPIIADAPMPNLDDYPEVEDEEAAAEEQEQEEEYDYDDFEEGRNE
ncbi:hypothetical protein L9F63_006674 [Diploptera punctata]|uniref:Kazal-like domain-containing protein n=1 Tax=Diploptera punctata TaxID=6984 RepID=A0AAD8E4G1_DIPPU|nr:hypothetical protein L9F63_006674 [Diploptera punctata]